jgi:hypothetical protein
MDVAVRHNRDGLAAAVRAGTPQREQVIDRGKVTRADCKTICAGPFAAASERELRIDRLRLSRGSRPRKSADDTAHRLLVKIVKRVHARNNGSEGLGYLGIARVRLMLLAIREDVPVDGCVKSPLDFARRPGKIDHRAPLRKLIDLKAVRLKPRRNGLNVLTR